MNNPNITPDFLKKISVWLKAEEIRLQAELAKLQESESSDESVDMAETDLKEDENALKVAQLANTLSLEESLEKSLRDVKNALQRIAEGDYGVCKYCEQPIDIKRLEARPTSSSCVDCKQVVSQKL